MQHRIYFPSLITSLLECFGVKKKKRDHMLKPSKVHTRELKIKVLESMWGRKTLCLKVSENIQQIKAARDANRVKAKNKLEQPAGVQEAQPQPSTPDEELDDQSYVTYAKYAFGIRSIVEAVQKDKGYFE